MDWRLKKTMAPREEVEQQTYSIIKCLFEDDELSGFRQANFLETDGTTDDDTFDPVVIADKLREVADEMHEDALFQAALAQLRQAAAEQAMVAAFSQGVEAVCQARVSQAAEVAPEMQLIRTSVALGLYIKNNSPELTDRIKQVMTIFLNTRVGDWLAGQGGWNTVGV